MRIIVPPVETPVTLEQVKEDLRILHDDDDRELTRLLDAATQWVERRTQMALMTQTRELDFPKFASSFDLRSSRPVQSIVSITYDTDVTVDLNLNPVSLFNSILRSTSSWPTGSNVTVRFIAGYLTADEVPELLKSAIRLKVQELYDADDTKSSVDLLLTNYLLMVA